MKIIKEKAIEKYNKLVWKGRRKKKQTEFT